MCVLPAVYGTKNSTLYDKNNYSVVTYHLCLKRRTKFYVYQLLLPCFLIFFLSVFAFLIPAESGERISYCKYDIFFKNKCKLVLSFDQLSKSCSNVNFWLSCFFFIFWHSRQENLIVNVFNKYSKCKVFHKNLKSSF